MVGRCSVLYGSALCDMAVCCVVGCTVYYGGVLCARAVYFMVGRGTVCLGGVLFVRALPHSTPPYHTVHRPIITYTTLTRSTSS